MNKILFFLLYLFVFFPFIQIIPLRTDTQINALIISFLIVIFNYKFINQKCYKIKEFRYTAIILMISILTLLVSGINFISFRSLFNYTSFFFVPLAAYICITQEKGIKEQRIKVFIWIWFIVAMIQNFISIDAFSFLLSRISTSETRGITSLATEPTYYGLMCLFFILFVLKFKKDKNKYLLFLMIQIVFLAKSSMATLMLFIFIMVFIIIKNINSYKLLLNLFLGTVFIILSYFLIIKLMPESRLSSHLLTISIDAFSLIFNDASVSQRSSSIYFSIKGAFENFLIPNGYDSFSNYMFDEIVKNKIPFVSIAAGTRIMSGIGASLYEIGIGGVLIVIVIISSMKKYMVSNLESIAITICVLFTMFMAFTIGNPIFCFLIGYGLFMKYEQSPEFNFKK